MNYCKKSLNRSDLLLDINDIPLSKIPDLIIIELNNARPEKMPDANDPAADNPGYREPEAGWDD